MAETKKTTTKTTTTKTTAAKAAPKATATKTTAAKAAPKATATKTTAVKAAPKATAVKENTTTPATKTATPKVEVKVAQKKVDAYNGPMLKITQIKSGLGRISKQQKTLVALGLRKIGQSVVKKDNAQTRGMIYVVAHLVDVKKV